MLRSSKHLSINNEKKEIIGSFLFMLCLVAIMIGYLIFL